MMFRPLFILLLCASAGFSLDSITCQVCPGKNPPGGMGKVVNGMARLTITIGSNCSDKYIKPDPSITGDPTVMWNGPSSSGGKCPKTWWWDLVVDHPNDDIHAVFDGVMPTCGGSGTGGSGQPPTFTGNIVHIDLDVDSDRNTFDAEANTTIFQHPPDRSDAEDAAEDSLPSLIMCMNTGHDEGGAWPDNDDWKKEGIVTTDIDLFQAVFEVVGSGGLATFNYPAYIKLYKANGSPLTSGTAYHYNEGIHDLLIEGIDYGSGKISVSFFPTNGHGTANDDVAFDVKQEERLIIGITGFGGEPSAGTEFSIAGATGQSQADSGFRRCPDRPDLQGKRKFLHAIHHIEPDYRRFARFETINKIDSWMQDDYTRGGEHNYSIVVGSNSWGAESGDAFVQHFKDTFLKHPRARVMVEGVNAILGPYNAIGPAVHRLNYYSDEKVWYYDDRLLKRWRTIDHWPRGTYVADAHLNKAYDIALTFDGPASDENRNITGITPAAGTPPWYWMNRYHQVGSYWLEDSFQWDIHILTEWVGTRDGYEKLQSLLTQNP